jgi:hypothetical protein
MISSEYYNKILEENIRLKFKVVMQELIIKSIEKELTERGLNIKFIL